MSSIARWSYKHGPATVWPTGGTDEWGQPVGAPPYLIPDVSYEGGGKISRDENGTEFVPAQTFRFEANYGSDIIPEREWYIKWGNHLKNVSPPTDAERIRTCRSNPIDELEPGGIPDWIVTT